MSLVGKQLISKISPGSAHRVTNILNYLADGSLTWFSSLDGDFFSFLPLPVLHLPLSQGPLGFSNKIFVGWSKIFTVSNEIITVAGKAADSWGSQGS